MHLLKATFVVDFYFSYLVMLQELCCYNFCFIFNLVLLTDERTCHVFYTQQQMCFVFFFPCMLMKCLLYTTVTGNYNAVFCVFVNSITSLVFPFLPPTFVIDHLMVIGTKFRKGTSTGWIMCVSEFRPTPQRLSNK